MKQIHVARYEAIDGTVFDSAQECQEFEAVARRYRLLDGRADAAHHYLAAKGITGRSASRATNILVDFAAWEYDDAHSRFAKNE